MPLSLSIDRFEGDHKEIAVLIQEDGATIQVPRSFLPKGVKAGEVLSVSFERDPEATKTLADETRKIQDDLKKTDPGGDISL